MFARFRIGACRLATLFLAAAASIFRAGMGHAPMETHESTRSGRKTMHRTLTRRMPRGLATVVISLIAWMGLGLVAEVSHAVTVKGPINHLGEERTSVNLHTLATSSPAHAVFGPVTVDDPSVTLSVRMLQNAPGGGRLELVGNCVRTVAGYEYDGNAFGSGSLARMKYRIEGHKNGRKVYEGRPYEVIMLRTPTDVNQTTGCNYTKVNSENRLRPEVETTSFPDSHDGIKPIDFVVTFSEPMEMTASQLLNPVSNNPPIEIDPARGTLTRATRNAEKTVWTLTVTPKLSGLTGPDRGAWIALEINEPDTHDRDYSCQGRWCTPDGRKLRDGRLMVIDTYTPPVRLRELRVGFSEPEIIDGDDRPYTFRLVFSVPIVDDAGTKTPGAAANLGWWRARLAVGPTSRAGVVKAVEYDTDDWRGSGQESWRVTVVRGKEVHTEVLISASRNCSDANAICAKKADPSEPDRPLKNNLGVPLRCTSTCDGSDTDLTRSVTGTFTAVWQAPPASHDGSTPFALDLLFSGDVDATAADLQNHAFAVTGGTITAAQMVDSRADLWRLKLAPSGTEALTLVVTPGLTCGEPGALCTSEGLALSNPPELSIPHASSTARTRTTSPASALTASFANAPSEHDGASAFTLTLAFSEAVFDGTESVNKNRVIRDALAVTGGTVKLTLDQEGGRRIDTDLAMRLGAVGFRGTVLDGSGPSGMGLRIESDAMWVRTESDRTAGLERAEGDASRLRLALESERAFELEPGSTLTPSARLGLRHDGGDAETGTGIDVGAGIRYTSGPLTVEGAVHALAAHEESDYEEWGASGAMRIVPGASGRGLSLTLAPAWGNAANGAEHLWSARNAPAFTGNGGREANHRIESELGYGLGAWAGVLTPYAGLGLGEESARTLRLGARWEMGEALRLGLEGTRRDMSSDNGPPEHWIGLTLSARW